MRFTTRMPSPRSLAACAALLFAALSPLQAQSVATTPVGAVSVTLPIGPSTSMISVPLRSQAVYTGKVSSVTNGTTITIASNDLSTLTLGNSGDPYVLRFLSGSQQGRALLVTSNTSNSVTMDTLDEAGTSLALNDATAQVTADDTFEIVPADTLGTLFGIGAELKLVGNTSSFTADTVGIWNGVRFVPYFYDTGRGYWVLSGTTTNANNTLIRPEAVLSVNRKSGSLRNSPLVFTFTGVVPISNHKIRHPGASTRMIGQLFPMPTTLSSLVGASDLTASNSSFTADTVGIWNGVRWVSYYRNLSNNWVTSGSATIYNDLVIEPGQAVSILRRTAKTGSASLLTFTQPYPQL